MKATAEQRKIALKKILIWQREQKNNKEKQNEIPAFDNEQMLLHFYDISEAIKLKFSKESITTGENLIITFKNQLISIEPSVINSALTYEKLNKKYKLEAKTFIKEIHSRFDNGHSHVTESFIVDFLNEIIKEKKLQDEKSALKRKIVWIKK
jgi:hypothetical protein